MSTPRNSFRTEKGLELPLLNLKGKEYLQVAHRVVWFREKYPDGIIKTQLLEHNIRKDDTWYAVFKAEVYVIDEKNGQPLLKSVAHQLETAIGFPDYLAKAETSAVGRALALAGIGTNFAFNDLDESTKLSDAPLDPPPKTIITKEAVLAAKSATKELEDLPPVSSEPVITADSGPTDRGTVTSPSFKTARRERENIKSKRSF